MSAEPEAAADLTEPREGDSNLLRRLRQQLKEQGRELYEVRREAELLREAGGEVREVERVPPALREALKKSQQRVKELEGAQRAQTLQHVFDVAGVPPGELRDMLGAKVDDPSSVTVEGLQDWMQANGITRFDPVAEHRSATTQRVDDLRANAIPVGSQKLPYGDYQQLQQLNPAEAARAAMKGQVDLPPHVMQSVLANREERQRMGGLLGE